MHSPSGTESHFGVTDPIRAGQFGTRPELSAGEAAVQCFQDYARERPEIVTMWAFGLGFVLGWKLRIW